MTKPSSAGKITIPASTRRLRSASHHEDVALEAGDLGEDANTTEDTAADAPEDTEGPSLGARRTPPEHHYNTRVTNDPHPARTARLARRNHAEVQEDLAAELRRKQAELAAQKDEYQRHINELAELEESIVRMLPKCTIGQGYGKYITYLQAPRAYIVTIVPQV